MLGSNEALRDRLRSQVSSVRESNLHLKDERDGDRHAVSALLKSGVMSGEEIASARSGLRALLRRLWRRHDADTGRDDGDPEARARATERPRSAAASSA
jgi:hypothetical protein